MFGRESVQLLGLGAQQQEVNCGPSFAEVVEVVEVVEEVEDVGELEAN